MPREQIRLDAGRTVTIATDDEPPLGAHNWAVVSLRLLDELSGAPPCSAIHLETSQAGLAPRLAEDGLVGLVGIPGNVFPALALQNYSVPLTIRTAGYLPQPIVATLNANPAFPSTFAPVILPDLHLHRAPVVIGGRVMLANGATITPLAGATIQLTGLWRVAPPASAIVPPDPPNVVAVQPPLYANRTAAIDRLRRMNLTSVLAQDKHLLAATPEVSRQLYLSDQVNLAVGDILLIDANQPDLAEYVAIQTIAGGSTPTQATTITLTHPLNYSHRPHAIVRAVIPQPPGADRLFAADAIAGDTTIFLNSLAGLNTANQVEVRGGAPNEYHNLQRYLAISDAAGYYRLPPLSRLAQIQIEATDGVHAPVRLEHQPDYSNGENRLDFTVR